MRIWDVDPALLCRKHLLGEHRELHGLWNILLHNKRGYSQHPETKRWIGKEAALFNRHEALVAEMIRRGYTHASPLDKSYAVGNTVQNTFIDPPDKQVEMLRQKACDCPLSK